MEKSLSEKFLEETGKMETFATEEGDDKYRYGSMIGKDGKFKDMTKKEMDAYRKQEESKFLKIASKYSKGLDKDIIAKVFAEYNTLPIESWRNIFYCGLLMIEGKGSKAEKFVKDKSDLWQGRVSILKNAARIARTTGLDVSKYCTVPEKDFKDPRAK